MKKTVFKEIACIIFAKTHVVALQQKDVHSCSARMHVSIEKATASAADLWDPRLGCLDAWCLSFCLPGGRVGTNLSDILEAFDHLWCLLQGLVVIWAPLE